MADTLRNVRNALKSIIPKWLSDRPGGLNVGFAVLYTVALVCDELIEVMYEGTLAPLAITGDDASTGTALPYVGQSRGIIRSLNESDDSYKARLRKWLDLWTNAGSPETQVQLIQTFLGNNLVVRMVDRAGNFVTANADGTTTTKVVDTSWNWDQPDLPARAGWWSDAWIIIYLTDGRYPTYTSLSDPAWIAAWGTYHGFGAGMQVPREVVDGIYQIIDNFKGAHAWTSAIIWTEDTARFIPGSLGGIPDGHFGNWSRAVAGVQTPARLNLSSGTKHTRYWIPATGG